MRLPAARAIGKLSGISLCVGVAALHPGARVRPRLTAVRSASVTTMVAAAVEVRGAGAANYDEAPALGRGRAATPTASAGIAIACGS